MDWCAGTSAEESWGKVSATVEPGTLSGALPPWWSRLCAVFWQHRSGLWLSLSAVFFVKTSPWNPSSSFLQTGVVALCMAKGHPALFFTGPGLGQRRLGGLPFQSFWALRLGVPGSPASQPQPAGDSLPPPQPCLVICLEGRQHLCRRRFPGEPAEKGFCRQEWRPCNSPMGKENRWASWALPLLASGVKADSLLLLGC